MALKRIDELKVAFQKRDRAELEELVLACGRAHSKICEISSLRASDHHLAGEHDVEKHEHVSEDEMKTRIKSKSTEELINLLADATAAERAA